MRLSGTIITSDKPIAVFGGINAPTSLMDSPACDYFVEELPPTNTWGRNFVTVPLATRLTVTPSGSWLRQMEPR